MTCAYFLKGKVFEQESHRMKQQNRNRWTVLGSALTIFVLLSACATVPTSPMKHKRMYVADQSGKMQSLQKQIREKNRRIEELESQLEALKLIDQDPGKQRKSFDPLSTMIPVK